MPNKYSHGLVFSHHYSNTINTHRPSLKPPSSRDSTSHTRSTLSSVPSSSNYSAQSSIYSHYLRLEPDPEPEPPHDYKNSSTHARHSSFESRPSDALRFTSKSSQRSRPPSDRLRLEDPFNHRRGNPPSPPPEFEPNLSQRPHYERAPSYRPNTESSPPEQPRAGPSIPISFSDTRPSLHHKSSSVETQIFAPEPTTSASHTRERQRLFLAEAHELHTPPSLTHERQHVFSMESPENSPPLSTEYPQRYSSEIQSTCLPSQTRDRRQSFIQETQALASPLSGQGSKIHSPFGTQNSPLFPSAQELQDYFSRETQGSQSIPAATGDNQDVSSLKARLALHTTSQDSQGRPSLDIRHLQSPRQSQDYQRRPSLGTQHFSSGTRTSQGSIHGQRQSIESQTKREHQLRPSLSSQQLSLEQFIQESEHIGGPSIDSQIYPPQLLSSYTGESKPRPNSFASTQRYTPKGTWLEHSPRSRQDRASKLPNTFIRQHRTLNSTSSGAYDNVVIETHGFPPQRPPSPPATPDSSKSFSLKTLAEEPQRTRPPPPIPQRSARRSPPRQPSVLDSTNSSVVYLPPEPPRPKTSSAVNPPTKSVKPTAFRSPSFSSPTFSISTRRSSINATVSPQSASFSNFSETMTSPRRVSFSTSKDREYFEEADLESLPSEVDFNILPYENPNTGPAVFRATQLGLEDPVSPRYEDPNEGPVFVRATQLGLHRPFSHDRQVSSRASSFDPAAPPPIGLNRRISHASAESYRPKTPKKESKKSLLSFLRSMPAPKAVLYSETTQGKPPVPVSVSRTAISIPTLLPGYRGQFPPPQKQDNGLRSSTEPRMRPGLDARTRTQRSTAHIDAAEKRKSWLKSDDADRSHGASRPVKKEDGELERILSRF
ncbi:hypothetical protein IMSHALPRED_001929 [Imshaugia aleurites]|uniref:Uncharacterized protein n=1 Tax=Imshaugia aleurites TaxID=172621 RepID=A0A8H3I4B8_9LECA|nr:hypothetical protein IMSHALPRED_001929 [Imshaugia aleurites]